MGMRFRRSIRARDDGTLQVRLGPDERSLLVQVANTLQTQLDQPDDPNLQRLFPPGYSDDAVRDAGYQVMMGDELRQRHLATVRELAATAQAEQLDPSQAEAWLRSINAVRLVLGSQLGITTDNEPIRVRRDDPNLHAWVAYDFLSALLDDLVTAMSM